MLDSARASAEGDLLSSEERIHELAQKVEQARLENKQYNDELLAVKTEMERLTESHREVLAEMKSTAEGDAEKWRTENEKLERLLVLREEKFNSVELDLQSLDDKYQNALTELSKEEERASAVGKLIGG